MCKARMLLTSRYSCEACNVGLHPDCFKKYHLQQTMLLSWTCEIFCCINLTSFAENI